MEGVRNINQAVAAGWQIRSFIHSGQLLSDWARNLLTSVKTEINYQLTAELMAELSGKEDVSELMAIVEMRKPRRQQNAENPLLVLFDRPGNRGNLGTILRTCDALGAEELILTGHGVDLYDPEVLQASMGSFFRVPVRQMERSDELDAYIRALRAKYPTLRLVGTTAHREKNIYEELLSGPVLLMLGNETVRLSRRYREMADVLCSIPMAETSSASSLNVACAASILLYEAARQRAISGTEIPGNLPRQPDRAESPHGSAQKGDFE
ncbi:MAG: hypothetical protein K2N94_10935 [Lachnospiraceae bacterium]|nr:hypothetical protein [Lachnospiraceae bacterium]